MIVTTIKGFTNVLGEPKDWDRQANGEVFGLPVKIEPYGDTISVTSAWKPTAEEMAALRKGSPIHLRVIGGQPPVSVYVEGMPEDLDPDFSEADARRALLLSKALHLCQSQFEAYASLHAAKHTPDGDEKAATNRKIASLCGDVLEGSGTLDTDYVGAFYDLAKMMDIGARAQSPAEVWRTEMQPRLAALIAAETAQVPKPVRSWHSRKLVPTEARTAFDTRIVADLGEGHALAVCDTFAQFAPLLLEAAGMPTGKRIVLPAHKASCHITHNDHRSSYQTVRQWIEQGCFVDREDFISPEELERAIETDELWTVQWYPDTPVGFSIAHASSLEALSAYFQDLRA